MRRALHIIYSLTLRVTGLFGLCHFALWVLFLESFDAQNMGDPFPLTILALFVGTSTLLALRHSWLPRFIARPSHPLSLLAILPGGLILSLLFFLATTICISMVQWEEPFQRNIAMLSGLISFALLSLAGLLGTVLALWPAPSGPAAPRPARAASPYARLQQT